MWLDNLLQEGAHSTRLHSDLAYFAEHALKLRPKFGPLEPFIFNPAQLKLHELLEEQRKRTGRSSRYHPQGSAARGVYLRCGPVLSGHHGSPGLKTIIIGHERRASSNLFQIVKRLHDGLPDDLRPSVGTSNAEELSFDRLRFPGYLVSVATGEGAGRSATAQFLPRIGSRVLARSSDTDGELAPDCSRCGWHGNNNREHGERL